MAAEMQRFGTREEEEEDDDDDMGMDVKEEDDDDNDDEEKNMVASAVVGVDVGILSTSGSNRYMHHQPYQDQPTPPGGGARRCRPQEEKKRTKLRERQRRAITAKIWLGFVDMVTIILESEPTLMMSLLLWQGKKVGLFFQMEPPSLPDLRVTENITLLLLNAGGSSMQMIVEEMQRYHAGSCNGAVNNSAIGGIQATDNSRADSIRSKLVDSHGVQWC